MPRQTMAICIRSLPFNICLLYWMCEIDWFSYWDITGLGKSTEEQVVRGQVFRSGYIQRRMISIVVRDVNVEKTVKSILKSAWTGEQGDGKIFVYDIEETYRIRNGESGPGALYNKE